MTATTDGADEPRAASVSDVVVARLRQHSTAIGVAVLAALAYLPALTAAPGRMPADSKLFVYLDPGRFLGDAAGTFDPRQYAGWVPHQHVAYLWPTGPWFWFFERLGVPDWIAHRLWIGTILLAAGTGVLWLARRLGLPVMAALVAALLYQCSPYLLPYVSRTSVLLLPFAGLGWIVGATVLATREPERRWRAPAIIALIVLTVGAVNATALLMIVPAPALWLVHAAWSRLVPWTTAVAIAARTALLSILVSAWWAAMLVVQGRRGADVLAYSESLGSVSFTSTSTEVVRGLGYWLFYVRDGFGATTAASLDHLVSGRTVLVGFVLVSIAIAGVVGVRWPHRRFVALLVGVGTVVAVGAHPLEDPSPLIDALVPDDESGLALALRSSTRAVPVVVLGLALAGGALAAGVGRLHRTRPPVARLVASAAIAVLAVANLPALWQGGFVDPFLERDQDPPDSWLDASADLDARPTGYRVLQLPGVEFGAFEWGYTVDQPLPSLTERPLVTRDLLPLGSPAAMDLVFALDDRAQDGVLEPDAIAPVARLLGIDTIWMTGDVDVARFRVARPEVIDDVLASAFDTTTTFGAARPVTPSRPLVDERSVVDPRVGAPIAPVALYDVPAPVPTVRVKDRTVIVSGSGDGLVDAAAAGLLDGTEVIVYAASIDDPLAGPAPVRRLIVTDSNRDRAHHWRSSQDVTGFTESAEPGSDLLRFEAADQRLPIFGDEPIDPDEQTVSVQNGPVTARATSYGEPFAYLPEHRPVMAVDGDRSTAWLVADRFAADGERLRLDVGSGFGSTVGPIDRIDLLQPATPDGTRSIATIRIEAPDIDPLDVTLDDTSFRGTGQTVDLSPTPGPITLTITSTTTPQPLIGDAIGAVGFAEVTLSSGGLPVPPTVEFIRPPHDLLDAWGAAGDDAPPLDIVATRLRTDPMDRWRDDPEPSLRREFELARSASFDPSVTIRLDARADGATLAALFGEDVADTPGSRLVGAPSARAAAAFDGDPTTSWITPFGSPVGSSIRLTVDGRTPDMAIEQPDGEHSRVVALTATDPEGSQTAAVVDGRVTFERPVDLSDALLTIAEVDARTTIDRRFAEPIVLPAAIAEIGLGDTPRPAVATPDREIRRECEPMLSVGPDTEVGVSFTTTVARLIAGDPVEATVCGRGGPAVAADGSVTADPGVLTIDSSIASGSGFQVDRVVMREIDDATDGAAVGADPSAASTGSLDPTAPVLVESTRFGRTVAVPPCPDGCWVVLGEGLNDAWSAEMTTSGGDAIDLGAPVLVDGNANGWWIEATDGGVVEIHWTAQRPLSIAFVVSLLGAVLCIALVVAGARSARRARSAGHALVVQAAPEPEVGLDLGRRPVGVAALTTSVATGAIAALVVGPGWGLVAFVIVAIAVAVGRPILAAVVGWAIVTAAGVVVFWVVRSERPFPDAGWPRRFEWLHPWTLLAVVLVATVVASHGEFAHQVRKDPMRTTEREGEEREGEEEHEGVEG